MHSNLVSVVISLYNKETHILRTLDTVLNQTYNSWECIIVDDGSTDNSFSKANEFIKNCRESHKFRIIRQNNMGQSYARNVGIKSSHGEFIAFLDGDDLWHPSKLEMQVDFLRNNPSFVMVLCGYAILEMGVLTRVVCHRNQDLLRDGWLSFRGFGGALESVAMIKGEVALVEQFDESLSTSAGLDLFIRISDKYDVGILNRVLMAYLKYPGQWHRSFSMLYQDCYGLAKKLTNVQEVECLYNGIENYRRLIEIRTAIRAKSLMLLLSLVFRFEMPSGRYLLSFALRQLRSLLLYFHHSTNVRILQHHFRL